MRDQYELDSLDINFLWCRNLGPPDAARKAWAAIQRAGGWSEHLRQRPEEDYFSRIDPNGSATLTPINHLLLEGDSSTASHIKHGLLPLGAKGYARGYFDGPTRQVVLGQLASCHVQGDDGVDGTARGLLAFACELYPHLSPLYGLLDGAGDNTPTAGDVRRFRLKELSWANFFGPKFVKHIGRDLLHAAPAWEVRDLPDGGVLLVATESYIRWRYPTDGTDEDPFDDAYTWNHPLAMHFHERLPGLKAFKPYPLRELGG